MADIIQLRRDTAANWVTANPVLHDGEIGIETDTRKRKCGNGTTAWNSLPYMYSDDLDQEPTANSHKPVESGGTKSAIDTAADIGLAALDAIGDADNVPTEESTELVRSGGVWEAIRNNGKGAFDISAYKAVGGVLAKYDNLAQALGTNGANVPAAARKPGMSVCFVLNSDNKYVQYRYMRSSVANIDISNTGNWAYTGNDIIVENPEFLRVYTDSEDRILWGIKTDGTIYFGAGVPPQIIDYVQTQISALSLDEYGDIVTFLGELINGDTLATLLNAKANSIDVAANYVAKVAGKGLSTNDYTNDEKAAVAAINIIENPEFLYLFTDNSNPPGIIFGYRVDGTVMLGFGIPDEIKAYVDTEIYKIKTGTDTTTIDGINKITAFLTGFTTSDTLSAVLANITTAKDGELRDWLGYKKLGSFAKNEELFTDEDVSVGKTYLFSFKLTGTNGAIGFFDGSDQRISVCGYGNGEVAGTVFNGRFTIPTGFKYAKAQWGGLADVYVLEYANPTVLSEDIAILKGGVKSYFKDELDTTIETILAHTATPAVVLPILTDSHIGLTARAEDTVYETISNVKSLCNNCYCDGIVHLGDLLMSAWNGELLGQGKTQEEANVITTRMMSKYLNSYAAAHPENHAYFVGGNHDGDSLQVFKYTKWYSMFGRKENNDATIHKSEFAPYFYVDFEKCNLRCIFLQQPNDYENNNSTTFGYTEDILDWLTDTALNVTDGTHVVMFSHIAPMQADYIPDGVLENRSSFYGICNAFNNHTTFSDSVVSCDFSALQTSKLLCYVCGHSHGDWIYASGETFEGTANVNGSSVSWTYENGLPCPIVIITNTYFSSSEGSNERTGSMGTYHVARHDQSVTQDAWDTFLYNPTEKKIYFIRFGSGEDRYIDLSSVI